MTQDEEEQLRSVAMQNAAAILQARRRSEDELLAAKEALHKSEEMLRATFAQAGVGIALSDLDGRLMEVNQKFCDIMGYPEAELKTMTAFDFALPGDTAATHADVDRLLSGEISEYSRERRYVRKDGALMWSLTSVTLLRDARGKPYRFISAIEDITLRKRAEEALQEETAVLELLNKTGSAIASKLDLKSLVQTVTDAATLLSGAQFGAFFYNVIDQAGESFFLYALSGAPRSAFEKFGLPRNTPVFDPTFRGQGVMRSDDITKDARYGTMAPHHGMPKGHLPVVSYLAVPVISRSGEVIGGLFFGHSERAVFTERTERIIVGMAAQAAVAIDNARLYEAAQKAAEERKLLLENERAARTEAERLGELKDEFLATLSHELRTPLSAILGWSQVLRRRPMDRDEMHKGLETIERNARMQTQLIEDLLDMSRITSGKVRLDIRPVDPGSIVEAAIQTVQPAADAKGIRLEKLLDPAAGPVSGDSGRLQQVVWNFLSNAIKFTPRDGKVQVLLERVNSHIEISVADTGIGINPAFLAHVFERFRQADASTTRKYGGLGIGLSIAKHLVELHGGTVRVFSAGEGRGATFTMQLPVAAVQRVTGGTPRVHPKAVGAPADDYRVADLTGIRVLVVDDEADARDLVKRVLGDCGAQVLTAASAKEALRAVQEEALDVLISDIGMPEVDGYELLQRIRSLAGTSAAQIPAIALTAFARTEDRTRALRSGFLMHIAKPVEPAELVAAVASVAAKQNL